MGDLTTRRGGGREIAQFDPTKTGVRNAALDSARRYAQNIRDWDALKEAVVSVTT